MNNFVVKIFYVFFIFFFQHELSSSVPLSYSHLDIAGSAGDLPNEPTGAPILALTSAYLGAILT